MTETQENDLFKEMFKYYKSKHPPPSLREVLDFQLNSTENNFIEIPLVKSDGRINAKDLGLEESKLWKTYSIKDRPGLLYLVNPFTAKGQRYWMRKCLQDYPKKPNKTNIDSELIIDDWWTYCKKNNDNSRKYLKKLRWTTLGYHHDWDTKVYAEESRNPFPSELAELCEAIARHLGYDRFRAQAAIVNYYHMDSTLSPHTDHSERDLRAPLISISFGQSAIFLIGGRERSQRPTALLLRSGDVVVMCEESRLSYHAVPRILAATDIPWWGPDRSKCPKTDARDDVTSDRDAWEDFESYVKCSRININVRQVLHEGETSLTE